MVKVFLFTATLLGITYAALRWYASRQAQQYQVADRPELKCTAVLRLSAKTRVYLVRTSQTDLLITESAMGASVTLLPAKHLSDALRSESR